MSERHVFRLGSQELTPTLEEYARISGLSLSGPCAHRQFLSTMGLTQAALLSEVADGHIVSLDFMIDRFGSSGSYIAFQDDFGALKDRW